MVKYSGTAGNRALWQILNMEIKKVPTEWQTGIIVPNYRKSDGISCSNYRAITLNTIPGKILQQIALDKA